MKRLILLAATAAVLSSCAQGAFDPMKFTREGRRTAADRIAATGGLAPRTLAAGPFTLSVWEKIAQKGRPARVYIEGDGLSWLSRFEISPNPTPVYPLALDLAAADAFPNVIYLARPCQYTGLRAEGACPRIYWTKGRTAPEVIAAYDEALDALKAEHGFTGYELAGYSGGAAVAVLVAAGRTDVTGLRTVAGNTDYAAFTALHGVSAPDASHAPEEAAMKIAALPQLHFIGGEDKTVPAAVFEGWKQASNRSPCVAGEIVPGNGHEKGWAAQWKDLLTRPLPCGR